MTTTLHARTYLTTDVGPSDTDKVSWHLWPAAGAALPSNRIERPLAIALVQSRSLVACCTPVHARGSSFHFV